MRRGSWGRQGEGCLEHSETWAGAPCHQEEVEELDGEIIGRLGRSCRKSLNTMRGLRGNRLGEDRAGAWGGGLSWRGHQLLLHSSRTLSQAPLLSSELCCPPPRNEDGDFLESVFPQISGDARAAVSMETFPANLGKEELGSPHHPRAAPAQGCRGAQVENSPPPPDFPSRGSASLLRARQLVLSLASGLDGRT